MSQPSEPADTDESLRRALYAQNWRYLEQLRNSGERADIRSEIMAALFDCIPDGMIVFDKLGEIVLANHAAVGSAGLDLENMTREQLLSHYRVFLSDGHTPLTDETDPVRIALREKRACVVELYAIEANRPEPGRWTRTHAAPVFDDSGDVVGAVLLTEDITERVKLQKQRDALVALVTHDIKNHLAAERSFLDFLPALFPKGFDRETTDLVESLKQRSDFFLGLANSLLELFRTQLISSSEWESNVNLSEILNAVIQMNQLVAVQRNVKLSSSIANNLAGIHTVPSVLRQVLHNIVINAIEVTPDGGVVRISASPAHDAVVVSVEDSGPGLTPEQREHIMDPRRVAEHMPKTTKSSGFGLYLSAVMMDEMGGKIRFQSEGGKGTTVFVDVPTC